MGRSNKNIKKSKDIYVDKGFKIDESFMDDKLFAFKSPQTGPIKQVIERISNVITECPLNIIRPDEDIENDSDDEYLEEMENSDDEKDIQDSESESNSEEYDEIPKRKKGKKTKKTIKKKSVKRNKGGIRIIRLNEEKTILVKLNLDADKFEYFRCDEPKITIGVDMNNLHGLLKSINDDDPIMIFMYRNNRSSLWIRSINDGSPDSENTDVEVFLVEINNTDFKVPRTKFENVITILSDKFHDICKKINNNSSIVEITSVGNQIDFHGRGESGRVTKTYRDTKSSVVRNKNDKVVQGNYEVKTLMSFSKCNKLCHNIEIYLKNDFPLVLVISVTSLGKLYVFVTPLETGDN